jgi:hypothetical protein
VVERADRFVRALSRKCRSGPPRTRTLNIADDSYHGDPNGGSARDYLPGIACLVGRGYGPTRERLSVCLCIGTLGVNIRICRAWRAPSFATYGSWRNVWA